MGGKSKPLSALTTNDLMIRDVVQLPTAIDHEPCGWQHRIDP
jgi:hypothetical protein